MSGCQVAKAPPLATLDELKHSIANESDMQTDRRRTVAPNPSAGGRVRRGMGTRNALDADRVVSSTEGRSFAEIEELKNLLIPNFVERNDWD